MKNKNLTLMISAILFTANLAFAMEEKEIPETPKSPIIQPTLLNEEKKMSIDPLSIEPLNLSIVSIEKTAEPLTKRKVSKTLPLNRRKSSGSRRARGINSPRTGSANQITAFLEDERKDHLREGKDSSGSSQEEKNDPPRYIIITPQEEEKKSPRSGFKRYSLIGSLEHTLNHPSGEQKVSPGCDGAISPMHQSKGLGLLT